MKALFTRASTDAAGTAAEMRLTRAETGQTADPHTAVALSALRRTPGPGPTAKTTDLS
jgi:threonine synthase